MRVRLPLQAGDRTAWLDSQGFLVGSPGWLPFRNVIQGVVFDVGEVLVNETREYGTWADWLGVPRHTFSAVFGAVIAHGGDYRDTFQVFAPGFDLGEQRAARAAAGLPETFGDDDLYPDVRTSLTALRAAGLWVALAGNQTVRAGQILRSLGLAADLIVTSDDLGVEKPDPGFFVEIERLAPFPAAEMLYVGDRLDNDVRPAAARGFRTALLRRGPWGLIQQHDVDADRIPTMRINGLTELPARIAAVNSGQP
jgi:FMN phosphatase YigB (HAD superfamily)